MSNKSGIDLKGMARVRGYWSDGFTERLTQSFVQSFDAINHKSPLVSSVTMAADRWTMNGCLEIIRPSSVIFQYQLILPVKTFKRSAIRIQLEPLPLIFLIRKHILYGRNRAFHHFSLFTIKYPEEFLKIWNFPSDSSSILFDFPYQKRNVFYSLSNSFHAIQQF